MPQDQENVTLKEYFDDKFTAQDKLINAKFDSLEKALILARAEDKVKFEHLNALRNEVTTDRGILVQKDNCDKRHKDWELWINSVNMKLTVLETRSITWTAAIGVFFIIIMIVVNILGKK